DVGAPHLLRPPANQLGVVGGLEADVPVHLGDDVVDPFLADPSPRVGVEVVIGLDAGGGGGSLRVGAVVAPDGERAHAELDPGLGLLDASAEFGDQAGDVVATPVGLVVGALAVALGRLLVVVLLALGG